MKKLLTILTSTAILFALTSCGSTKVAIEDWEEMSIPLGTVVTLDNFEEVLSWEAIDANGKVELSKKWKAEGKTSLLCSFAADTDQTGFICNKPLETNWGAANWVMVDVNNTNKFDIHLEFAADSNKSEVYRCPPGKHKIIFDISKFSGTGDVKSISIYQNGKSAAGSFAIDNLILITPINLDNNDSK